MDAILTIIIVVLVIFIIKSNKKSQQQPAVEQEAPSQSIDKLPYTRKMLLTKAEYAFYQTLKVECDKNNLLICPKVRMEDFINVVDKQNYTKYRGYIKSRHIDFLICNNKLHIIAGLELDDNTHNHPKIQKTDEFKANVFKAIALPLFRVKMSDGAYKEQIEKIINELTPKSDINPTNDIHPT